MARLLSVSQNLPLLTTWHTLTLYVMPEIKKIPTLAKLVFYWGRWVIKKITE